MSLTTRRGRGSPSDTSRAGAHPAVLAKPAANLLVAADENDDRAKTFGALADRRFRVLWLGGLLVFVAVQAQQIARGQLAYEMTGSAQGLGGVFLGFGAPMLILTPFGGVAADRFPKRTMILQAQTCLVLSALWIGVADLLGVLEYWMLVVGAMLQGTGFAFFGPARVAMTAEIVPRPLLGNAIVLTQLSLNSTRIFAPALAGALIGVRTIGTTGVYLITAGIVTTSLVLSFWLPRIAVRSDRPPRSALGDMVDGVRYVARHPRLRLLMAVSYVLVMIGFPYIVFLPAMAQDVFDVGVTGLGVMSSATAFGALVVMVWVAGRSRPSQAWKIQSIGAAVFSLGLVAFGLSPSFVFSLVALAFVGGAASAFQSMNNTLTLTESDIEYHGRVQSLLMLSFSGYGITGLPLGALGDEVGLRSVHVGMGVVCLVAVVVYVFVRRRVFAGRVAIDL